MNNDVSERLAMVRIAGLLAVSMSLGGCSTGSSVDHGLAEPGYPRGIACRLPWRRSRPRHRRRA